MKTVTDLHGNTWNVYETAEDYITHNIAPGLGDIELTHDQAQEVASRMLIFYSMHNVEGKTTLAGLVEHPKRDFWNVVAEVLGDA